MKRLLIILLWGVLAVVGCHAQGVGGGVKAARSARSAKSAGNNLVRNLQKQSRRAEQAARGSAAANRVKLKPSGTCIVVPVSNLDNDDQKQKNVSRSAILSPCLN